MAKNKIWILKAIPESKTTAGVSPFCLDYYNVNMSLVVAAETEPQARALAQGVGADEVNCYPGIKTWTSDKYSTCEELKSQKEAGVLVINHKKTQGF